MRVILDLPWLPVFAEPPAPHLPWMRQPSTAEGEAKVRVLPVVGEFTFASARESWQSV